MLQQAQYVIWAGDALRKRSSGFSEEHRMLLTLPRIWKKDEGGRSVWTAKDHAALVKLTVPERIRSHRSEFPEIGELPGNPPIDLQSFDRWWSLERVGSLQQWVEMSGQLKAPDIRCFNPTGLEAVDEWTRNVPE